MEEKVKKPAKQIERITIYDETKEKLNFLTNRANDSLNGMASISKSDLMNLLIELHESEFSAKAVKALKEKFLTEVKFAEWLAREIKVSQKAGGDPSLVRELIQKGAELFPGAPKEKATRVKKPRTSLAPNKSEQDDGKASK